MNKNIRLKYYLRGIGIGIIVAVAICICANLRNKNQMTDDEIRAKAAALGMVENNTVLAELEGNDAYAAVEPEEIAVPEDTDVNMENAEEQTSDVEEVSDEATPEETVEATPEATEEPTPEATPEITPEPTKAPEPTPEPTKAAPKADEEYIVITVDKGNGSDTVASKLASAGLVDNASDYDKWLIQNGYDRRIAAGTHEIPKGASKEEIAKILTTHN